MAVKTKTKTKPKRKASGTRNETPKITCDMVLDFRTPLTTKASGELATIVVALQEKKENHALACRKHYADGGTKTDCPEFDLKNIPNINKKCLTQSQHDKLLADDNAVQLPRYNPVLVEFAHLINPASCLRSGSPSKYPTPPKGWDEKEWGPWHFDCEDEDGKAVEEPSHWFFDKNLPRRCHSSTAESMVTDPEANIFTLGNNRYVVGDGTSVRSAAMLLAAQQRGNYAAGDIASKRMTFAGNKDVVDIVFRIEDRANNGGGVMLKGDWKGNVQEVVVLPGQALTAGFLFDAKGKRMTAKQIRSLEADILSDEKEKASATGLKFKTVKSVLDEPIILGKEIFWSKIWAEIQVADKASIKAMRDRDGRSDEWEPGTPQDKSLLNHRVTCRVGPTESHPHGFRAALCDMVPFEITGGDEPIFGMVIGARSNHEYSYKLEAEEEEATPKKVTRKATSKKPADSKKKPADAAPPIEGDNADETADVETKETVKA